MLNRAVVAGVFVAGIGTGVTIDSAINTNPDNLASRDAIDRNAPNPKLCLTYGYVSYFSLAYSLTHPLTDAAPPQLHLINGSLSHLIHLMCT